MLYVRCVLRISHYTDTPTIYRLACADITEFMNTRGLILRVVLYRSKNSEIEIFVLKCFDLWWWCHLKVRQIRNDLFKPTFLPKNERKNSILLLVDLFSFIIWKKVETPKRHFEINWPLVCSDLYGSLAFQNAFICKQI